VRVIRAEKEETAKAPPKALDTAALAKLPQALRQELEEALSRLDMKRISEVIQCITVAEVDLGKTIQEHAEKFDYSTILAILRKVP